jgi:hypothetical protein
MRDLSCVEVSAVNGGVTLLAVGVEIVGTWALSQGYLLATGSCKWNKDEGVVYNLCFNAAGSAAYIGHLVYINVEDTVRGIYDGAKWGFNGCK